VAIYDKENLMPWVKFLKDHKQYKNGQVIDLPSFKAAFRLKNAGIVVRVEPPLIKKLIKSVTKKSK